MRRSAGAVYVCGRHSSVRNLVNRAEWSNQASQSVYVNAYTYRKRRLTETALLIDASRFASLSTLREAAAMTRAARGMLSFQASDGKIGIPFNPIACCIFKFDVFLMYSVATAPRTVKMMNSKGIKATAIETVVRCASL